MSQHESCCIHKRRLCLRQLIIKSTQYSMCRWPTCCRYVCEAFLPGCGAVCSVGTSALSMPRSALYTLFVGILFHLLQLW